MHRDNVPDSVDGKLERAKDKALGKHDDNPGVADHVGEAAGGIGGVTAGAAIGSIAGPVGTVLGGVIGAMTGWWAGRAAAEAATSVTADDEAYYRGHYDREPIGDRHYDEVRPAYYLGHVASRNPEYRDRPFEEIETDLRSGWTRNPKYGSWDSVRNYASEGYSRGSNALRDAGNRVANAADDLKDRVDANPASKPGPDSTDNPRRF